MPDFNQKIDGVANAIREADAVLIGAGAGLSASAGLDYAGPAFREKFADYIDKYGFEDLYSSGFYDFPTEEEYWTYWARHVDFARFSPPPLPLYRELLKIVADKQYFVITTNVDGQFIKAGFSPSKVFEVQGDYAKIQCAKPCHDKVYSNEAIVKNIMSNARNLTVDASLVPRCTVCAGPMKMYLRIDGTFVQDEAWDKANDLYALFISRFGGSKLVILEIGVGYNTPSIIRYPFQALAAYAERSTLIRINREHPEVPGKLEDRAISFNDDAKIVIDSVYNRLMA